MIKINSALLLQVHQQGLSINAGVAVDARLIKFASRPVSNEQLNELKQKTNTPEGKLDKNGQVRKYNRDLESDWTIKNDKPHYGLKEHVSADTDNGLTPSSHNDFKYFSYAVLYSMHDNGNRARFSELMKNIIDIMFREFALNLRVTFRLRKGAKILEFLPV